MTESEQKRAAKQFSKDWKGKGEEKGQNQSFWLSLLQRVYGVQEPEKFIVFEKKVQLDNTSFIDGYIPSTRVLIEQKSLGKDLTKPAKQSDGKMLTPYEQAKRYSDDLPYSMHARWIVVCNFSEFHIHDMENPKGKPEIVLLENLEKEYYRLQFLVDSGNDNLKREMEISIRAGEIVGVLYDAFLAQYKDPTSKSTLHSLNVLCVRLVFCLYAEDAGVFGKHGMFHDYLSQFDSKHMRKALIELFDVLDTVLGERDPYLEPDLAEFPYVNGGLFDKKDNIEIPMFTDEIRNLLLVKASEDFDWSEISPTIFGAVFESTLNPETRRSGGMHYTSVENIHKVIDPLFLDDLQKELSSILARPRSDGWRTRYLHAFQDKLAGLTFLDPACGSGNFLTETYLSLRRMENEVILEFYNDIVGQMSIEELIDESYLNIKVSISQFYGIEINDFAVTVAKTALWIAESQMMQETEKIVHMPLGFLPLKTNANIRKENALRVDWETIVPKSKLSYIMGNPPFVGQQLRNSDQSEDMTIIFGDGSPETKLDYVLGWYKKAYRFMHDALPNKIYAAFVSTNSICQGECVPTFWKNMFDDGVDIGFAYRSFKWQNESTDIAAVFCVIVGFSSGAYNREKYLFDNDVASKVDHINAYLHDAPDIWITSRKNIPPIGMPKMIKGSEPSDGGNLFVDANGKDNFVQKYPTLAKYIKPFVGGDEYISNQQGKFTRYCFWLVAANPADYARNPELKIRLANVAQKRAGSNADRIRKRADYPYLFCQIRQPSCNYLIFPQHTTSDRKYIPIGFMDKDVIVGNACYIIPNASIYLFGILTSSLHMAWTSLVCGRLGNGYRYSPAIYNNFPWPSPTDSQKTKIEQTAQAILNARAIYPDSSLSDLYDSLTMPPELQKAHKANDKAVMEAYGFDPKIPEPECVAALMRIYQTLTQL